MNTTANQIDQPPLISYGRWLTELGVAKVTGWRWRRKGWIKPVNICGKLYLTSEDRAQFKQRAMAGEFAQESKTPSREVR
jgi:hypothetical protein